MDNDLTINDALEMLTDQKAKLEDKLDKTVNKIQNDLAMLEHLIKIIEAYRTEHIGVKRVEEA